MNIGRFILGAAIGAAMATSAQASLVVGSNDSGNCYPYNCNDSGTASGVSIDYYQIYSASAFAGPINIGSITYYAWAPGPANTVLTGDYDISFGVTSDPVNSLYPVTMSGTATFVNAFLTGSISGTFDIYGTEYLYNPADGNLVIHIVVSDQDALANGWGGGYFQADYTGLETSRAYLLTGSGVAAGGGALVTGFNVAGVPEASSWAMLIAGFGLVGATLRRNKAAATAAQA